MTECKANETPCIQTLSYPGCIEAARAIVPFIRQFDVGSAACAIFCINSWHENRSSQNSAYALNAALLSIDAFGTRQIADYKSFSAFFSRIKEALSAPCSFEDEVVPVMGQTLIPFRGKWHRALHGCGATLEYPRLCFASTIIDDPTEISEFEELLDYVDEMSQKLGGGEWQNSDAVPGDMQMPSCDYWDRTCRWMGTDPVCHLSADTIAAIDESTSYVENKCFLMNGDRTIPLFCPSILEDYLTRSMAKKRTEKNQAGIDVALLKQARAIFDSPKEKGSSVLAFPLFLVNDKPIENCPSTFLVLDGKARRRSSTTQAPVIATAGSRSSKCFSEKTGHLSMSWTTSKYKDGEGGSCSNSQITWTSRSLLTTTMSTCLRLPKPKGYRESPTTTAAPRTLWPY